MTSIKLILSGASARAEVDGVLTSGMVGVPVTITYDSAWDGLTKTLVCKSNAGIWSVPGVGKETTLAHEALAGLDKYCCPRLSIGVEGRNADGKLVIPSVMADCGRVQPGANPDGDPSTDPENPVWAQILAIIGDRDDLNTEAKDSLVAAINEVLANSGGVDEEEVKKLVEEYLTENPPSSLTINGTEYNGSEAMEVDTRFFEVTVTATTNDDGSTTYTSSHTYTDIKAAYDSGRIPVAVLGLKRYQLTYISAVTLKTVIFERNVDSRESITIKNTTSATVKSVDYVTAADIPDISQKPVYLMTSNEANEDGTIAIVGAYVGQMDDIDREIIGDAETAMEQLDKAYMQGRACFLYVLAGDLSGSAIPCSVVSDGYAVFSYSLGDVAIYASVEDGVASIDFWQEPDALKNPNALTIDGTTYDGSEAVEVYTGSGKSILAYGAKGDGATDDTTAFQASLAENRVVSVPGGTYVLSDTLVIGENCCLELSQDTILQFSQADGNCIEMRGSATLRGNHAILSVPYAFTGNVISCDTALDGDAHNSIPPYAKADPMFKRQRFIYDVNIVKPTAAGFYRTTDGSCTGTAIYLSAEGTASINWMWAVSMSGIRIAGGFSYGIRAANFDDPAGTADNAWNHDMRIEAVIEACEISVALENCNGAHLAVTVQPCAATDGTVYAKHGVYLNDSRFVDMVGSRIWDWNASTSLWTAGGEYQHLAMIGNCRGLILDDFLYYESGYDIRDLIYTDTESNLENMTILQEPVDRWFKSVDGVPYFNDGTANRKLMLNSDKFSAEQMDFIHPADGYYTYTPNFTNLVSEYEDGYLNASGVISAESGYVTTGFIPIDGADTHTYRIGGDGISWNDSYGYCRIAWYDADKALKGSVMAWSKIGSGTYYPNTVEDDTVAAAFVTHANVVPPNGAAYFRITAKGEGANLVVTIDEEQSYTAVWHGEPKRLDDSIHAKNDWNAAEGEVGYIANRTHYDKWVEVQPETSVELSDDGAAELSFSFLPTAGNTYRVMYKGTAYETVCVISEGAYLLGDLELVTTPFAILIITVETGDAAGMIMTADISETVSLTIYEQSSVTIPEKYIPASIPRSYTVVVPAEEISDNTVWTLSETADKAAQVLYYGGDVWIDYSGDVEGAVRRAKVYLFILTGTLLVCRFKDVSNEIAVTFAEGTWTPPTT